MNINTFASLVKEYQIYIADTPSLKEECFKVRHAVYCQELGFEAQTLSGLERDPYDHQAIHILIRSHASGEGVGCLRLVRPSGFNLPIKNIYPHAINFGSLSPHNCCEFSRAAILPEIRRCTSTQLALLLYFAGARLACDLQVDGAIALMEARFARRLRQCGIQFQQVGDMFEHRGQRAPFLIARSQFMASLSVELGQVLEACRFQVHLPYLSLSQAVKCS